MSYILAQWPSLRAIEVEIEVELKRYLQALEVNGETDPVVWSGGGYTMHISQFNCNLRPIPATLEMKSSILFSNFSVLNVASCTSC